MSLTQVRLADGPALLGVWHDLSEREAREAELKRALNGFELHFVGPEGSNKDVDFYLERLTRIKGERSALFSFSAFSGDPSCPGTQSSSRLEALARRSGGTRAPTCAEDFSRSLEELSRSAFGLRSRFPLTKAPNLETLSVFVDHERLEADADGGLVNWTYDEDDPAIEFGPLSVPGAGSTIRVEYQSAACISQN